jgi:hypothetical protein
MGVINRELRKMLWSKLIRISHGVCSASFIHRRCYIINILLLVEGVMVDYHTRGKISHSGRRISPETITGKMSTINI